MAFLPTEEQQHAIDAQGTVLVSAAAGSGKTAVLVERIVRLLTGENAIDADRILVVTFTKAAAAEMRNRIYRRLTEVLQANPDDVRLQRQMVLLRRAKIGTTDRFCGELVREYFHILGFPPDIKVAEKSALQPLQEQALNQVLATQIAQEQPAFEELLDILNARGNEGILRETIQFIYTQIRSLPFPKQWIAKTKQQYRASSPEESPWMSELVREGICLVRSILPVFQKELDRVQNTVPEEKVESFREQQACLSHLYQQLQKGGYDTIYRGVCVLEKCKAPAKSKAVSQEDAASLKQLASAYDSVIKKLRNLFAVSAEEVMNQLTKLSPCVDLLLDMVWEYWETLYRLKLEKKCLDFADMEYAALSLLVRQAGDRLVDAPQAAEIIGRFDEVLVDEYQDTNDLQNALFEAVSDHGKHLFTVGDIKQSIYRFRQANPQNFIDRRTQLSASDDSRTASCVMLDNNFRSHPQVCDGVNYFFHLLMTKECGGMDYTREEELVAKAKFPMVNHPAVEIQLIDQGGHPDSLRVLEGRRIASYIQSCMDAGPMIAVNDTELRPAKYSDFTILLRSTKDYAPIYQAELAAKGIPSYAETKSALLQASEIKVMLSLIQVIENPLRDIPLLAVLLSPMVGFTSNEVAQLRLTNRQGSLFSVLCEQKDGNPKVAAFLELHAKLRNAAAALPCDRLVQYIYRMTGYDSAVLSMERGEERFSNLRTLQTIARTYSGMGSGDLTGFLRFVERAAESGESDDLGQAREERDAVRICTMHKSKGLQFPVCIVAGLATEFSRQDVTGSLLVSADLGLGLRVSDPQLQIRYSTLPRDGIGAQNQREQLSEELRVLYVALTRAQDRLVLVGGFKNLEKQLQTLGDKLSGDWGGPNDPIDPDLTGSCQSFGEWILSCMLLHPGGEELRRRAQVSLRSVETEFAPSLQIFEAEDSPAPIGTERKEISPVDEKLVNLIRERLEYEYPYAALNRLSAKQTASALAEKEAKFDRDFSGRPAFLSGRRMTPAQRGTATHLFMEHADFDKAVTGCAAERDRLVELGFLSEEQGACLDIPRLDAFFQSDLFSRMQAADRLEREYEFMLELSALEVDPALDSRFDGETVVVQGMMDCVLVEPDGLILVDYKTDRGLSENELVERYRPQLALYAKALKRIFRQPVKAIYLYSFAQNTSVEVTVD